MGKLVMKDPFVEWGGADISDLVRAVGKIDSIAAVDTTTSQDTGDAPPAMQHDGGLRDCALEAVFVQDFAAQGLHARIGASYPSKVAVKIRAHRTAVSATNPEYRGTVMFNDYSAFGGEIGARVDVAATWPLDGAWSDPVTA